MPGSIRRRFATLARWLAGVSFLGMASGALAGPVPLQINTSGALPTAIAGSAYLQALEAQGGVPPYAWVATIPASLGLTLSQEGVLSGTPVQPTDGPVQLMVLVADSVGVQAHATLTLEVVAVGALTITTPFLLPGVVGTPYDQVLLASDGTATDPALSWSFPTGTLLPAGFQIVEIGRPAVAHLIGTPTQPGIFPIVLNLSDNFGHTATRQYILTIAGGEVPPPYTPAVAVIGVPYSFRLQPTNAAPWTWSLFSGQLPPGLELSPAGTISGTVPAGTTLGVYPFAVTVTDANGAQSVEPIEIEVQAAPPSQSVSGSSAAGCTAGRGLASAEVLLLTMVWLSGAGRRMGRKRSA
jgi:hypothetical protein